jgi:uncharacterized membrane protein YphA (DoxX/SURF4 family)
MVGVAAAVVLGAVFVVAGGSKLAMGRRWPVQAAALGVPAVVSRAVPWWELAVGAALIARLVPRVASAAALVTLLAFTVLLVTQLARGHRPVCACFGTWRATPIGVLDVARNAVLAALAVVVLAAG